MGLTDLLPFRSTTPATVEKITPEQKSAVTKIMKAAVIALGFRAIGIKDRAQFEEAPYDFERIIQAIDTDSYVRQAFSKYKELMWKEGWEIVSENPEAVAYLWQRIDYMELAMGQPFHEFLTDVADQVMKFSNCFIVKSRGDLNPFFPGKLVPGHNEDGTQKLPLIGYELVPTHTMQILRDKHNNPMMYRQVVDDYWGGFNDENMPTWPAEDVIHFHLDRKTGRSFGTPFLVTVMDDVIALRQIEEDLQNLVHQQLFPLYKYKVGTDEHPAEPEEIEAAARELEDMRTEGGLVLPDRHDVEVIGAEGNALDAAPYLAHFKERVCVGMGLAPHHLGMNMAGGNRSVTDRLDIALYDKIKTHQRYLARMLELHIFHELLVEGGFDPMETPIAKGVSDRCKFKFREIDVDTQVKRETHEIQKYAGNVTTHPEVRLALGLDPEANEEDLMMGMQTRLQPTPVAPTATGAMPKPIKPDAKAPSTGGRPNRPNTTKGVGNQVRPANQFGRRSSPNIRHADLNGALTELVELIDDGEED